MSKMVTLLNHRCIFIVFGLLMLMSILTLHTLFTNSMFGLTAISNNLDAVQPVIITSHKPKQKQNPWTSKMIKHLIRTKQTAKERKIESNNESKHINVYQSNKIMNKIKVSDKKAFEIKNSTKKRVVKPDPNRVKNHQPFSFIVGMDNIKKAYKDAISNLTAINTSHTRQHGLINKINKINNMKKIRGINNQCRHKHRVFVLGIMKTGTTSMTNALAQLGYHCTANSCIHLGNWFHFIDTAHLWQPFEVIILSILNMTDLFDEYLTDAKNALAFGDSPWCFLYPIFDKLYPDSKYILMTRKDDQTYVYSYLTYLKKFNKKFVNKGLTNKQFALIALRRYHLHNAMVRNYFEGRPDDLLEITVQNVNNTGNQSIDRWDEIVEFLGCKKPKKPFPHDNKSKKKGKRSKYVLFNDSSHSNDQSNWNWRETFGDNIPYVTRDENEVHSLHIVSKDEFILDWNLFVVDELKVSNPLSNVTVIV